MLDTSRRDPPPAEPAATRAIALARRPALLRRGLTLLAVAAVLGLLIADSTIIRADEQVEGTPEEFDAAAYVDEIWDSKVLPAVEDGAVPLPELLGALAGDPEAAREQYGHQAGTGAYSFLVQVEGTVREVQERNALLDVPGVPAETTVAVQVKPPLAGTALRDAVGFITFDQFVNQIEYADVGTELNRRVEQDVLATVDQDALAPGATVTVAGAFTELSPTTVSVVPVRLEVAG